MAKLAYVVCVMALLCGVALVAAKHAKKSTGVNWAMPAINRDIIAKVNADEKSTWTAGVNNKFKGMLLSDVKAFLGAKRHGGPKLPSRVFTEDEADVELPTDFDARTQWGNICASLYEVRDQSLCGSCWAFGASEAMTDRLCIASNGAKKQHLSAADLLACCDSCGDGCDGGYPSAAWQYWVDTGLVSGGNYSNATGDNGCYPYPFPPCEHHVNGTHYPPCAGDDYPTPTCPNKCSNKAKWASDKVKASDAFTITTGNEDVQKELMAHGPLEVDFTVYEDFLTYKSGVYQHTTGSELGGHAVKLIGWGVEDGVNYWTIVNSWNSDWGDNGQFKILRGSDECGIEDDVNGGTPAL